MAKVVGKKAAAAARKRTAGKRSARPVTKAAKKPSGKGAAKPKRPARKPAPKAKPVAKKAVKPPKPASRPKPKGAKPAPKPSAKPAPKVIAAAHPHPQPKPPAALAKAKAVAPVAPPKPVAAAKAVEKKRTRRPRPRVTSSGPPTAAWFVQGEKPRSSSFIPAPPRAEAPSLVAAPPASSDRLISANELTEFVVRTVPVRVDVEAGGGRIYLAVNPSEVALKVGEGIEWDFRYVGGADVIVDELSVEFDKPSPFSQANFKSRRPGAARPHRQLSGAAQKAAAGKRVQYVIRAINSFKTELATARPAVAIS